MPLARSAQSKDFAKAQNLRDRKIYLSVFLLKIVDVNCFSAGGFSIVVKPPGYATISGALYFLKKHSPVIIKFYNHARRQDQLL